MKKVYFKNSQWRVTRNGLEAIDGSYFIARDRLTQTREDGFYSWPLHMGEKGSWVDYPAFIEAFKKALDIHGGGDPEMLARSVAAGTKRDREARDFEDRLTAYRKANGLGRFHCFSIKEINAIVSSTPSDDARVS